MWESLENEDENEFENDFIASTNEFVLTNKLMQRYESDYYRAGCGYHDELPSRVRNLIM
jgi:hypothetical protein